jgi:hypothetical protein
VVTPVERSGEKECRREAARFGSYGGRVPPTKSKPVFFGISGEFHLARKVNSVFCVASWRPRASGRAESSGLAG